VVNTIEVEKHTPNVMTLSQCLFNERSSLFRAVARPRAAIDINLDFHQQWSGGVCRCIIFEAQKKSRRSGFLYEELNGKSIVTSQYSNQMQ
jgi:hypothetical protein